MEMCFTTVFYFNEFIFVYVVNIIFICDGEIYLLTYHQSNEMEIIIPIREPTDQVNDLMLVEKPNAST